MRVKGHPHTGYHIERVPDILVAADAQPSPLRDAVRAPHLSLFQNRLHEYRRDAAGRSRTSRTAPSCSPKNRPRAAAARAARGHPKNPRHLLHILLRPPIPPAHAPLLTLVAGLAARDAAAEELDALPDIRWPERPARRRAKILRHPHGNACRARPHPPRRGGHRDQRQPIEDASRSRRHRHVPSHRDRKSAFTLRAADSVAAPFRSLLQSVPGRWRAADSRGGSREVSSYLRGETRADHHGDGKLYRHHGGPRTERRASRGARRRARHRSSCSRATWRRHPDAS